MATTKLKSVNGSESQVTQKRKENATSAPIRVRRQSKAKLEQLLREANKTRVGRKIKADDLIWCGLNLITDDHIEEICERALSNKDRMEILYRKLSKEKRGMTRDEFFGMLLDGKVAL